MDLLSQAATRAPHALAVREGSGSESGRARSWTYAQLDAWVDRVAESLAARGVGEGGSVAMKLPPSPRSLAVLHAVWRLGALLIPLHRSWTDAEVVRGLAATGPPTVLLDGQSRVPGPDDGRRSAPARGSIVDDRVAVKILTSGSTGAPRPVSVTHGNLAASARAAGERLELESVDRWLTSLSLAHIGGLALAHRAAWTGCSIVTVPRFEAQAVGSLIDSGGVTHASLVPVMLQRLMDARGDRPPPDTLRLLLIGGAETPAPLLERALQAGYPLALTYGLTEATSQVATATPGLVRDKPGTVGAPLPGVTVRIASREEGRLGEIMVRGPTVTRQPGPPGEKPQERVKGEGTDGSRARSEAEEVEKKDGGTEATVNEDARESGSDLPHSSVYVDESGWLHTGDLGRLDEDGHLWVAGRRSARIVTGGVTVEPAEVEEVLLRHPSVREVAVIGVPDEDWGERVVAVVVPDGSGPGPSLAELLEFTRDRLAPAKRPRGLRVVEALPRNANGKVDRVRLVRGESRTR